MKTILYLFLLSSSWAVAATDFIVGYYPSWMKSEFPASELDIDRLTHVMHAFAVPTEEGAIIHDPDFLYPELNERVHQKGRFILLSLGGWGNSDGFSPMAADSVRRHRFVQNVLSFCLQHNYDGIDLDWEHPAAAADRENMTLIVKQLREEFNKLMRPRPLFITMAVTAGDWMGKWLDYDELVKYIDWFGCMTYDFHGPWTNHAGHNSPLFESGGDTDGSVDSGFRYLTVTRKVPAEKILLGVPFYGRGFNAARLYGASTGAGSEHRYSDIPALIDAGWIYHWDDVAKVPYITNPEKTKLISFDDTLSVRLKAEYAWQKKAKGLMIWALGQDFIRHRQPLLEALSAAILDRTKVGSRHGNSPPHLALLANYPNPFNESTIITFDNPQRQHVVVELFDIHGRLVQSLFHNVLEAGVHTFRFAENDLPSGILLCRLSFVSFSTIHKMTYFK